jgi:hypothetical protein
MMSPAQATLGKAIFILDLDEVILDENVIILNYG